MLLSACCSVYGYYTATDVDLSMLHVAQCMLNILYCYRCGSLYVACCSVYADYTAIDVDLCMLHVDRHHPGTQRCWWTGLLLHIQR